MQIFFAFFFLYLTKTLIMNWFKRLFGFRRPKRSRDLTDAERNRLLFITYWMFNS